MKFYVQILEAYQSQGGFSYIFVINCHLGSHLVLILFLLFIWLQAKCLQLNANFIAYNLRKKNEGAQWLSGRVLDSRPKGRGFEPHRRHCVVVLEQDTFILA